MGAKGRAAEQRWPWPPRSFIFLGSLTKIEPPNLHTSFLLVSHLHYSIVLASMVSLEKIFKNRGARKELEKEIALFSKSLTDSTKETQLEELRTGPQLLLPPTLVGTPKMNHSLHLLDLRV